MSTAAGRTYCMKVCNFGLKSSLSLPITVPLYIPVKPIHTSVLKRSKLKQVYSQSFDFFWSSWWRHNEACWLAAFRGCRDVIFMVSWASFVRDFQSTEKGEIGDRNTRNKVLAVYWADVLITLLVESFASRILFDTTARVIHSFL